jgi:Protein of unknown function (DUF2637)
MTTTQNTAASKNLRTRTMLTAAVAAGSFYISASHIVTVATAAGNHGLAAYIYPVAVDAVILVSVLTLVARVAVNKMAKFYARLGRIFGFSATIYCNVSASGFHSVQSMVIDLIPAVAAIIVMELLVHTAQATPATRARSAARKPTKSTKTNVTPIRKAQ